MTSHVYPGDTAAGQSFVHIEDLMDAIPLCVERRSRLPQELALLIGEPGDAGLDELQNEFGRLIHREARATPDSQELAKTGAWLQDKAEDSCPIYRPGRRAVHQALHDRSGRRPF